MDTLATERREGIVLIRLERPQRRNALNMKMLSELDGVLADVERDESIRGCIMTGNEQAFSAGQDLKEEEPHDFVRMINAVFDRLEALPVPTVAAIDGWCLAGGLELALSCDMRICSEEATIGDRHAPINSIGGAGATVRLTRLLGSARAKEMIFTGMTLKGDSAAAFGLVSYVYPAAELVDRAVEHARSMCVGNRVTVAFAKQAIRAATEMSSTDAKKFALICQENVRARLDEDYSERFRGRREPSAEHIDRDDT